MVLPKKGDIIRFPRGYHEHFGIYCGDGNVIHVVAGARGKSFDSDIRENTLKHVARGSTEAEIFNFMDEQQKPYSPEEIVERARSRLGPLKFNLFSQNCEHFVTWCRYGEAVSKQVERTKQLMSAFSPTTVEILEVVEEAWDRANATESTDIPTLAMTGIWQAVRGLHRRRDHILSLLSDDGKRITDQK